MTTLLQMKMMAMKQDFEDGIEGDVFDNEDEDDEDEMDYEE